MVAKTSGKAKELRIGNLTNRIDSPVEEAIEGSGIYWRIKEIIIEDLASGVVQYALKLYRQDSDEIRMEHYTNSVSYTIWWE